MIFSRSGAELRGIALLTATYFAAAKFSLLLAIPPGYATAVWPPSGIALAALLLGGTPLWPGVWLGAALTNLTVQGSPLLAGLIATGNTLEAVAGAELIRRWAGGGRLDSGEQVVKFVGSIALSATIAACIGVFSLATQECAVLVRLRAQCLDLVGGRRRRDDRRHAADLELQRARMAALVVAESDRSDRAGGIARVGVVRRLRRCPRQRRVGSPCLSHAAVHRLGGDPLQQARGDHAPRRSCASSRRPTRSRDPVRGERYRRTSRCWFCSPTRARSSSPASC